MQRQRPRILVLSENSCQPLMQAFLLDDPDLSLSHTVLQSAFFQSPDKSIGDSAKSFLMNMA